MSITKSDCLLFLKDLEDCGLVRISSAEFAKRKNSDEKLKGTGINIFDGNAILYDRYASYEYRNGSLPGYAAPCGLQLCGRKLQANGRFFTGGA